MSLRPARSARPARANAQHKCASCGEECESRRRKCATCWSFRCKQYFCDETCLSEGWPSHKAAHAMLQFLGAIRIARFMDERQEGMQQERNHQLANSLFLLLRPPDNSDTSAVQLAVSDAGCVDMALRILPTVERREDVSNLLVVLVHLLRGEHTSTRIVQRMLAASPAADVLNIFFGIIVQQTRLFRNAPLHTLDFGPRSACFTIICLILQAAGDAIPAILITDAVREAFVANLKITGAVSRELLLI